MNRKILEHWMSREINKEEDRYIFISDNKRICEAIMTVNFCSVYLTSVSSDFFELDGFKTFLKDRLYGCNLDQYVFVPCCLRKKTNDAIEDFCKKNYLEVRSSGWSIFREKEYLAKYEYQDELEQTLISFVKRFEGPDVSNEDLRQFHNFNASGTAMGVNDYKVVEHIMESVTMFVLEQEAYVYQKGVCKR